MATSKTNSDIPCTLKLPFSLAVSIFTKTTTELWRLGGSLALAVVLGTGLWLTTPSGALADGHWIFVDEVFQLDGDAFDTEPTTGMPLVWDLIDGGPNGKLEGPFPDVQGNPFDMDDWTQFGLDSDGIVHPEVGLGVCLPRDPLADPEVPWLSCGHVAGLGDAVAADQSHAPLGDGHTGGNSRTHFYIKDVDFRSPSNSDDVFKQGSSLNLDICDWTLDLEFNSPKKNDIEHAMAAFYNVYNQDEDQDETLFVAAATLSAPNGSAKTLYWILRNTFWIISAEDALINPDLTPFIGKFRPADFDPLNDPCEGLNAEGGRFELHVAGDLAFAADYENGGSLVVVKVFEWMRPDLTADGYLEDITAQITSGAPTDNCQQEAFDFIACATANADASEPNKNLAPKVSKSPESWDYLANISDSNKPEAGDDAIPSTPWVLGPENFGAPILPLDFPGTTFFEGGINLTAIPDFRVGCFGTFIGTTVASASLTASMKDAAVGSLNSCSIEVVKTGDGIVKVGDPVDYTITITNTGALTLYKQSIVDSLLGDLTDGTNAFIVTSDCFASLAPDASCTITAQRTAQATDPSPLDNTVTVIYDSEGDLTGDEVTGSDDHDVILFDPSVTIEKLCDDLVKAGDPITCSVTFENTSSPDTPALTCTVVDSRAGSIFSGPLTGSVTETYSYTAPTGDGTSTNRVDIDCEIDGFENEVDDFAIYNTVYFTPGVSIDKSCDPLVKGGDPINCEVTVTNTSTANTPALTCAVNDSQAGSLFNDILVGSEVFNYTYTAPTGDGTESNTVTVLCDIAGFENDVGDDATESTDYFTPGVSIDKTCDDLVKGGDAIDCSVTFVNTSSANTPTLTCTVGDDKAGPIFSGELTGSVTETYSYTAPAGDGTSTNRVDIDCAIDGFENRVDDFATYDTDYFTPGVSIEKTCDDLVKGGDAIDCSVTFANTSSANTPDLTCTVEDDQYGSVFSGPLTGSVTETYSYTAPAGGGTANNRVDIDCAIDGFENRVDDFATYDTDYFTPGVTIDKTCDDLVKGGDPINCSATFVNTSSANTPALLCTVTDDKAGTLFSGLLTGSVTASYQYTAPAGDGTSTNTVDIDCAIEGFENRVDDDAFYNTVYFTPSIGVAKIGDAYSKDGDVVNYTITLSNTSSPNTPDMVCTAIDTLLGPIFSGVLPPGDTVFNPTYTVSASDPDPLGNTVTLSCSPAGFENVFEASASHLVDLIHPNFEVTKTCDVEPINFDDPASFTVTIANTGDVDLIVTADDGIGGPFTLPVGQTNTYTTTVPGPHTPGGTADNTVTASWTLPALYELPNTDTKSASDSCDVLDYEYETAFGLGVNESPVCFTELGQGNWGWLHGGLTDVLPGIYTWDVWAGAAQCNTDNGTWVGTVTVVYDPITYEVSVTWNLEPWVLLDAEHVYAGYEMPNSFSPGQYENYGPFDGTKIYIIVHAVVGVPQ